MGQTGFKQTGPYLSCDICGDNTGRCRIKGDLRLCMTYPTGDQANDQWHYIGPSKGENPGLWGVFVPFDPSRRNRNWRETYWEDREQDEADMVVLRSAVTKPKPAPTLKPGFAEAPTCSLSQRAEAYGALFNGWSLARYHRQQLSDRYGWEVTRENEHTTGVISVNSVVNFDWHHPFPGGVGSDHCTKFRNGMALSIPDERGRIIGVELKPDDPMGGGKYRWLSRPEYCDLGIPEYDNENPLGIFTPVCNGHTYGSCINQKLIGISEGRGMKPRIAASKWRMPVIGGGGHAAATGSPSQLNRYLLLNPGATVLLLLDAGALNNKQVARHVVLNARFCRQRGFEVLIPWWGQNHIGVDPDPDEVPFCTGIAEANGRRFMSWDDGRYVSLLTPEALELKV